VASVPINGFSNGPYFFDLCLKCKINNLYRRFVAINVVGVNYPSSPPEGCGISIIGPSMLEIYELNNTLIKREVTEVGALVRNISICKNKKDKEEILIGLTIAPNINELPSLYNFKDPRFTIFNGESGGISIYNFNGAKLCRVLFQPVTFGSVTGISFYPNCKYLSVSFTTTITSLPTTNPPCTSFRFPDFIQTFRITKDDNKCNTNICLYPIDIPRPAGALVFTLPFSYNGKWQIVSGGIVGQNIVTELPDGPINNLQLYKISRSEKIEEDDCDFEHNNYCVEEGFYKNKIGGQCLKY
jgi:hypothetical protein